MEITETRRIQLRHWFSERTIPPKEKSYLSQLMTGTASFGERAARRLERDYGMGHMYLDRVESPEEKASDVDVAYRSGDSVVLIECKSVPPADEMDLMWVSAYDRKLLTLVHGTDEDGRRTVMRAAEAVPRVVTPVAIRNKQQ